MDPETRKEIIRQLADAFGELTDATPEGQPLHVVFNELVLPGGWTPSPVRALAIYTGWPEQRPEFYVDLSVVNRQGEPLRSPIDAFKIGEPWRGFSFTFPWPQDPPTAVRAIQLWITRFVETT
jgi:hypothetical protein